MAEQNFISQKGTF